MYGLATMPVATGALATGVVFGAMNIAMARNPEMSDKIFTNSLIAFALIETFVFIGVGVAVFAHLTI